MLLLVGNNQARKIRILYVMLKDAGAAAKEYEEEVNVILHAIHFSFVCIIILLSLSLLYYSYVSNLRDFLTGKIIMYSDLKYSTASTLHP